MTERLESPPTRPPADVSNDDRLRGDLGTADIVVMVLAYAGPLAVVGLFMSFVIGYGVGAATPLMFVVVTASLCLFSVGYVAMSRCLPRPGALYTYVTAGLGRPIGLSAGLLAILSYCFFGVAYHAGLAIVLQVMISDFGGPVIAWPILVAGSLLLTQVLGHFRITLSARILTALMLAEVSAILVWDTAIFVQGGPEGRPLSPLTPAALGDGPVALALLLAAVGFVGFESTAVFRDEMRDPDRTVPRATFLAVLGIGLFYVVAAWAAVVAYGPGAVKAAAHDDPAGFFTSSVQAYLGTVAVHVMSVMLVSSYLAGTISEQTHVCLPKVEPTQVWRSIREDGVTHLNGAPTVLSMLAYAAEARDGVPGNRRVKIATGGAPPSPAILRRMDELGFDVTHLYGLTETFGPVMICDWRPEWSGLDTGTQARLKARQGVGNVISCRARVVAADGVDVPADGVSMGQIALRGNNLMLGYLKDDEATEQAVPDGWFRTGDIGVMQPDGYVELRDRAKDIIISGGENIASVEVEQVIADHPAVLEVAVVAVPDTKWGEVPAAFVTLRDGMTVTEREIIDYVSVRIARFKAPKRVIFGELPKTSTGKIRKHLLRDAVQSTRIS